MSTKAAPKVETVTDPIDGCPENVRSLIAAYRGMVDSGLAIPQRRFVEGFNITACTPINPVGVAVQVSNRVSRPQEPLGAVQRKLVGKNELDAAIVAQIELESRVAGLEVLFADKEEQRDIAEIDKDATDRNDEGWIIKFNTYKNNMLEAESCAEELGLARARLVEVGTRIATLEAELKGLPDDLPAFPLIEFELQLK